MAGVVDMFQPCPVADDVADGGQEQAGYHAAGRDGSQWSPTQGSESYAHHERMASIRRPRLMRTAVAVGAATLVLGIVGLIALAGWTAGAVLTLDGRPITVHSVDCGTSGLGRPGMSVTVTAPSGWPGTIYIGVDTHPFAPNTPTNPSPPTYSISWDVFRSMTWTNEGDVTYWHGYLDATLTGGHRLVGVLSCR
jgi:hypothetical protein